MGPDDWWVGSTNQNKPLSSLCLAQRDSPGFGAGRRHLGESATQRGADLGPEARRGFSNLFRSPRSPVLCSGKAGNQGGAGYPALPAAPNKLQMNLQAGNGSQGYSFPADVSLQDLLFGGGGGGSGGRAISVCNKKRKHP